MNGILQDVRYALRQMRKSPGFTAVVVLTLALGIGANSAIFSVVQGVVLAPLSFNEPDRLVVVWQNNLSLKRSIFVSSPDFREWQRNCQSFQQMAALTEQGFDLTGPGTPEHLEGKEISSGFFSTLGVKLALGREFTAEEDRQGGAPGVIISDRFWRDRFAGNIEALGKSITMDGVAYTIVGVLPPQFHLQGDSDVYTPLGQGDPLFVNDRTVHRMVSIARLKPSVSMAQAQMEMNAVQGHLNELYPTLDQGLGTDVMPLKQFIVGNTGETLLMLLGAVGLVLLITCANVASLMLACSTGRSREFAIRSALGGTRARLFRQLLTESLLLSFAGGALGVLVAICGVRPALSILPGSLPRIENIGVNAPVLLFTLGISLAVGIFFGLASALKSRNLDPQSSLKDGGFGTSGRHSRVQSILVIGQMAMTLVLLAGAGLLLRTINHLRGAHPGFDTQNIITFKVGLPASTYNTGPDQRIAYRQLIDRIRQVPGVQTVDLTVLMPLSQTDNAGPFWASAQPPASIAQAPRASFYWTGPDYLKTMGIALVRGRFFTPADTTNSERVVVIDSVLANSYFPDKDPIDQTMMIPHWGAARIVGVVHHVRHWDMGDSNLYTQNQIYASFYQLRDEWVPTFSKDMTIVVRTPLDAATLMPDIKRFFYGAEQDQPIYEVRTMQEMVSDSMSPQRLPMMLLVLFAGLALLLAAVGIYGVISYSVSQRVREIGVRTALGASRGNVLRMVVGQGLKLAGAGLAIGVAVALILTRLLSSFSHLLYGISGNDPATFVAVSCILMGVAIAACYIPARRAAKVDPMVVLRYE